MGVTTRRTGIQLVATVRRHHCFFPRRGEARISSVGMNGGGSGSGGYRLAMGAQYRYQADMDVRCEAQ